MPKTRDPVWDEVVSVEVAEHELDREKVLLAVVNHDTNKLMAKAAVPLQALEVGRHYGLALDLGGGASLNVTVVIPQAPARELEVVLPKSANISLPEHGLPPRARSWLRRVRPGTRRRCAASRTA